MVKTSLASHNTCRDTGYILEPQSWPLTEGPQVRGILHERRDTQLIFAILSRVRISEFSTRIAKSLVDAADWFYAETCMTTPDVPESRHAGSS